MSNKVKIAYVLLIVFVLINPVTYYLDHNNDFNYKFFLIPLIESILILTLLDSKTLIQCFLNFLVASALIINQFAFYMLSYDLRVPGWRAYDGETFPFIILVISTSIVILFIWYTPKVIRVIKEKKWI